MLYLLMYNPDTIKKMLQCDIKELKSAKMPSRFSTKCPLMPSKDTFSTLSIKTILMPERYKSSKITFIKTWYHGAFSWHKSLLYINSTWHERYLVECTL